MAELVRAAGVDERSMSGILGGFGLRLSGTRGYPSRRDHGRPTRLLIERERGADGVTRYRLKPIMKEALDIAARDHGLDLR
jgi:hypothetical protein